MYNYSKTNEVVLTAEPPDISHRSKCTCTRSPNSASPLWQSPKNINAQYSQSLDNSFEPSYVEQTRFKERYPKQHVPRMPPHSTPKDIVPDRHESFGSQINYNLGWMPSNCVTGSDVMDSSLFSVSQRPGTVSHHLQKAANVGMETTSLNSKLYSSESHIHKRIASSPLPATKRHNESLLEWPPQKQRTGAPPGTVMLDQSSSHLDISSKLRSAMDTDLIEAVDKLAKAKAMLTFEGAVKAAEEAAANAPPEYAEEAAAASAEGYQAEVTGVLQQQFTGVKPIEVIGYVGITRPKNPKTPSY